MCSAAVQTAVLGMELVCAVFETHAPARHDILVQCQAKLLGAKDEETLPFVGLLATLMQKQLGLLTQHTEQLKVWHDIAI